MSEKERENIFLHAMKSNEIELVGKTPESLGDGKLLTEKKSLTHHLDDHHFYWCVRKRDKIYEKQFVVVDSHSDL
jgi:hypothetical protein